MKERIKQYMDYKSISAGELSSLLDVQRSNISHILNGRNKPGASFIEKFLIVFPDLNARWLLTGEGEMVESVKMTFEKKDVKQEDVKQETEIAEEKIKKSKDSKESKESKEGKESLKEEKPVHVHDKPIDKVVLLYKDGTFTDFKRE